MSRCNYSQSQAIARLRYATLVKRSVGSYESMLFGDFDLDLCSWTIHNLKEFSKSNMLKDHIQLLEIHTAPGACLLYAPGTVFFSNMVLEHI